MSPKSPVKGTIRSDSHTQPIQTPGPSTLRPITTSRADAGLPPPRQTGDIPSQLNTDAPLQHAAIVVTVNRTATGPALVSAAPRRPLQDYWITMEARLPAADSQGLRVFKRRHYVDVAGGHIVQVAIDPKIGVYRAKLASERVPSGPLLVRDHDSKLWQPLEVSPDHSPLRSGEDLNLELSQHFKSMAESADLAKKLQVAWHAIKGEEGERAALVQFEVQCHRHLATLEKTLDFYVKEQLSLLIHKGPSAYGNELFKIQGRRFEIYTKLMVAGDWRKHMDIPPDMGFTLESHRSIAGYLKGKLVLLRKRQSIADEMLKKSRYSENELAEMGYDPMEVHENTADWLHAKSHMLAADLSDRTPVRLSLMFSQTTLAFRNIDNIPLEARIPVLSDLVDQCSAIRASFEYLEIPSGTTHAVSRQEMVDAITTLETLLEDRITLHYQDLESAAPLPMSDQSIDFDFIPAQGKKQSAATSRRMFRSKQHGIDKIRIGQSRRNAVGQELIDVMHPHKPAEVLQTYERREGEWRRVVAIQEKNMATLADQAGRLLELSDSHVRTAHRDEAAKRNATNIVEFLGRKAEDLDDLCVQMERASPLAANEIAPLVQRLKRDSQRLRDEGEAIRVRLYKDKNYLSADRVAYLIRHEHLSVRRTHTRLETGKGQQKHFLDIYSLNDRLSDEPLWQAHFHYEKSESPALEFKVKGGHLKTLEQSGSGAQSQRQDEQAGRPHVAIWRETLDGRTAQKIFELAS